jgi:DNA-binding winged helix-turn-helix (wHTH) protein
MPASSIRLLLIQADQVTGLPCGFRFAGKITALEAGMSLGLTLNEPQINLGLVKSPDHLIYEFHNYRLDPLHLMLYRDDDEVSLTPKQVETLLALVEKSGEIVSKDVLMERLWGDTVVEEANLIQNIHFLRKELGNAPDGRPMIETLRRRGYRFTVNMRQRAQSAMTGSAGSATEIGDDKRSRRSMLAVVLSLLALLLSAAVLDSSSPATSTSTTANQSMTSTKFYWEMAESEQLDFLRERATRIEILIGDVPRVWDEESVRSIKAEVDSYVERKDSLSQAPFKDGLRVIFGRASQYTPLIAHAFERHHVPPAVGLYQAMIESEFQDCLSDDRGKTGLFQFTSRTAAKYGLDRSDECDVEKQANAAARFGSDLLSDFGSDHSSWTLALLSFSQGGESTREQLRELRAIGKTERSFWVIFENRLNLSTELDDQSLRYLPRFFAAAIIGETPNIFDLSTPALTTLHSKN